MIDPAISNALDRIAARDADARGAYVPGFSPAASDVASRAQIVRDDDPLSVALPEGAFALTSGPGGEIRYGRAGAFAFSDGRLVAGDGSPALGFPLGSRTSLVPLRIDPYDAATGGVARPRIEADGTIVYDRTAIDPRTGARRSERVAVGRLALARFPAGTQPERIDAMHVRPPAGVAAQLGVPGEGGFGALATRARDLGRVDVVVALDKMKEAYVAFEALRAAKHGRDGTVRTAMDLVK